MSDLHYINETIRFQTENEQLKLHATFHENWKKECEKKLITQQCEIDRLKAEVALYKGICENSQKEIEQLKFQMTQNNSPRIGYNNNRNEIPDLKQYNPTGGSLADSRDSRNGLVDSRNSRNNPLFDNRFGVPPDLKQYNPTGGSLADSRDSRDSRNGLIDSRNSRSGLPPDLNQYNPSGGSLVDSRSGPPHDLKQYNPSGGSLVDSRSGPPHDSNQYNTGGSLVNSRSGPLHDSNQYNPSGGSFVDSRSGPPRDSNQYNPSGGSFVDSRSGPPHDSNQYNPTGGTPRDSNQYNPTGGTPRDSNQYNPTGGSFVDSSRISAPSTPRTIYVSINCTTKISESLANATGAFMMSIQSGRYKLQQSQYGIKILISSAVTERIEHFFPQDLDPKKTLPVAVQRVAAGQRGNNIVDSWGNLIVINVYSSGGSDQFTFASGEDYFWEQLNKLQKS